MLQAAPASCWNPPRREGGGLARPRLGRVPNMLVQACPPRPWWAPKYPSSLGKARPHSIRVGSTGRGGRGLISAGWSGRTLLLTGKYRKGGTAGVGGDMWGPLGGSTDLSASPSSPLTVLVTQNHLGGGGWGEREDWSSRSRKCAAQRLVLPFPGRVTLATQVPL